MKGIDMIAKLLDTLTGASVKEAVAANSKTAADLRDAVKKAREAIDAAVAKKETEERKAAKAAKE